MDALLSILGVMAMFAAIVFLIVRDLNDRARGKSEGKK